MADIVDSHTRSRMMASIRSKDTRPELRVRRYLHANGLRFRLHPKNLPGRPDIVLARYRTAIMVHGCFWHRHPGCDKATNPATRPSFWQAKFEQNVRRDAEKQYQLEAAGWAVETIWECESDDPGVLDALVERIRSRATA